MKNNKMTLKSLQSRFNIDISKEDYQKMCNKKLTIVGAGISRNHDMFLDLPKDRKFNRDIIKSSLNTLDESMHDLGNITPVIAIETHSFSKKVKQKNAKGYWQLFIADGNHRMTVAKAKNRPFFYIVLKFTKEKDDKVSEIIKTVSRLNNTSRKWRPIDYAQVWAMDGKEEYQRLILELERSDMEMFRFSEDNKLEKTLSGVRITDVMMIVFGSGGGLPMKKYQEGNLHITESDWKKVEAVKAIFQIIPPTAYARRPLYSLMKAIGVKNHQVLFNAITHAHENGVNLSKYSEIAFKEKLVNVYNDYTLTVRVSKKTTRNKKIRKVVITNQKINLGEVVSS